MIRRKRTKSRRAARRPLVVRKPPHLTGGARAARAAIVVTHADLASFAAYSEGTAMHSSLSLYAGLLSELEDRSVLIVDSAGAVKDVVDLAIVERINRSLRQIGRRRRGPLLVPRQRARRGG